MELGNTIGRTALRGLEHAVNRVLTLDSETARRLAALDGRLIELHIRGPELRFCVAPQGDRIRLHPECARTADTTISGTPLGLARNWLSSDPRRETFAGDIEIGGDTETARLLKSVLDELDIDWEEQLSRLVGDVVAHQAGNLARGFGQWSSEGIDSLNRDVADWLHEESRLLPARPEVDRFLAAVDALRNDADRLEQRIERLAKALTQNSSDSGRGPAS